MIYLNNLLFSRWKDSSPEAQQTELDPLLRATVVSSLKYAIRASLQQIQWPDLCASKSLKSPKAM